MKAFVSRALMFAVNALVWCWAGFKLLLDWIGRSTAHEDFESLVDSLPAVVSSLYQAPWWAPAALATTLSIYLAWLTWPRSSVPDGYEEMASQYQMLKSQLERAIAVQPAPGAPLTRTWADESTALKSEISWGVYQFIFEQPLRCVPAILMLEPIPGDGAYVQEVKANGFTVYFTKYKDDFPIRFFADAREDRARYDPLEETLGGRWLGDRFVFKTPMTILDAERTVEYQSSLELPVKPCPPGSSVEVQFKCDLGPRDFGLSDGKAVLYGSGISRLAVSDRQTVTFSHHPTRSPIAQPYRLQLRILSWRHSGEA